MTRADDVADACWRGQVEERNAELLRLKKSSSSIQHSLAQLTKELAALTEQCDGLRAAR